LEDENAILNISLHYWQFSSSYTQNVDINYTTNLTYLGWPSGVGLGPWSVASQDLKFNSPRCQFLWVNLSS